MSGPVLTRSDRQYRREKVIADLRAGNSTREVAARHGLSVQYVKELARSAGVCRPVGRPRVTRCEAWNREYSYFRKKFGAQIARQMIGLPL